MSGAGLTQGHIQNAAGLLAHRVKEKVKSNLTQCYESKSVVRESVPLQPPMSPTCQRHAATHAFAGQRHAVEPQPSDKLSARAFG